MNLSQFISKIPKPILVLGVLFLALLAIVLLNPMRDECEIKTNLFLKQMAGVINSVRVKSKQGAQEQTKGIIQFAQISYWKDRCQQGNSIGACEDYFNGLKKIVTALIVLPEQCQIKLIEKNELFLKYLSDGIQIMSLVAWGEKPPAGAAERAGWLTEVDLRTFCGLQKEFLMLAGDDELQALKDRVYHQYPEARSDKLMQEIEKKSDEKMDESLRDPVNRPLALKTVQNPAGTLEKKQIFERSLFSIRCDLY
ncbi:MAG: hypothetical protein WA160_17095 [Pseudobdellovibrio sp.]